MPPKKISIDPTDMLIIKKKTGGEFVLTELAVYLSQVIMFLFVAAVTSNMLKDETALTIYMKSKINEHSLKEVGCIILATLLMVARIPGTQYLIAA